MPRLVKTLSGPLGPQEVRVAFIGWGEHPPTRYAVYRGPEVVGFLLDWSPYAPVVIATKDPRLGYVMPPTAGTGSAVYGAERRGRDDFEEIDDAWPTRRQAVEAILGEALEEEGA